MKRRANHRLPASYFADAPTISQGRSTADHRTHNPETVGSTPTPASTSAESENRGRSAAHTAGAARREAAGESDSAGIFDAPMIAAKGEQKQAAGGGVGFAAASIPSKGVVR